jgi:hypothetical protein
MRETIPLWKLYKTLILIAIVVLPIYWLTFTTDGKRRTDTMVLWLAGGESIDVNFKELDRHFVEIDWKTIYPDLEWQCKPTESSFGNKLCFSEIASYNGVPASYISIFFNEAGTSAVKLGYRDQYHGEIGDDLLLQLGQPEGITSSQNNNPEIYHWQTGKGQVLLKRTLQRGEEPVLIWLAENFSTQ